MFGIASVPWTYAFVAGGGLPLWPSFVAAATYYAAGGGTAGLVRGSAGNLAGVAYAAVTLALVESLGGGVVALSLLVGAAMFIASLHPFVEGLSFAPAGFLGYATLFGVHAGGAVVAVGGLPGETLAAAAAMLVGAAIGFVTDRVARRLAPAPASVGPG